MSLAEFLKQLKKLSENNKLSEHEKWLVYAARKDLQTYWKEIKELKNQIKVLEASRKPAKRILSADQGYGKRK